MKTTRGGRLAYVIDQMKPRRLVLAALTLLCGGLILCICASAGSTQPDPSRTVSNDYLVAHYPGITLADVTKTHGRFFQEATGYVTIDRRDRSLRGHCRAAVSTGSYSLWQRTGERWPFLFDTALRCSPTSQEIVCSSPASNQINLYSDDSIIIPSRGGVTVVLGLHP